jgi:hypothetical protein
MEGDLVPDGIMCGIIGTTAPSEATRGDDVSQRLLERIQDAILRGEYDLTRHAVEEMAEDDLIIFDVESAILDGEIVHTKADDPRGSRYTVIGLAQDGETEVGVVGRFTETGTYLVITVYEVTILGD